MSEKSASPAKVAQLVAMLCMVGVTFAFGIRVSLRGTSTRKHDAARMDEFDNEEAAFQVALNSALIDSKQTMTFTHQVAGHVREKLRLFQRSVLKPLIKRKHFFREMQFYYAMEKMGNHWMQSAKSFVPALRGLYRTKHEQNDSQNEKGNEIPIKDMKHKEKNWSIFSRDSINAESFTKEFQLYLALEDLTCDLIKPCAIDIKMGTQTFEPDADELKRRREVRKCPHQAQVGFRITGFQVYDVRHDTYGTVSKHFGRRLTVDMIVDALALFFFDGIRIRREVVLVVLQKLENLLLWMKSQSHLEFYCSSILIVYDGYQGAEYSTRHRGTEHARIDAETSEVKHFLQHLGPQFPEPHPAKPPKSMDAATPLSPCGWDDMPESDFCSAPIAVPATTSPKSPLSAASLGYHHRPPLDLENQVHVKMIDFAHALPGNGSVNTGYMIGLRSLISRLHRIASMHDQLPKSMLTQRF